MTGRYALIANLDLSTRLIPGYIVMATGFVGGAFGVIALTSRRVLWAPCDEDEIAIRLRIVVTAQP